MCVVCVPRRGESTSRLFIIDRIPITVNYRRTQARAGARDSVSGEPDRDVSEVSDTGVSLLCVL